MCFLADPLDLVKTSSNAGDLPEISRCCKVRKPCIEKLHTSLPRCMTSCIGGPTRCETPAYRLGWRGEPFTCSAFLQASCQKQTSLGEPGQRPLQRKANKVERWRKDGLRSFIAPLWWASAMLEQKPLEPWKSLEKQAASALG